MERNDMRSFSYSHIGNETKIQASGDTMELAAECGFLIHTIYSVMMRKNPVGATAFKMAVLCAIASPGTPTWEVGELRDGSSEILMEIPKDAFGKK